VGNIVEVPLAQTGEGIAECELLKWYVQEVSLVVVVVVLKFSFDYAFFDKIYYL